MYPRSLLFLSSFCVAVTISGCGPSQSEVERVVKSGIEEKMHIKVKSLTLTKGEGGKYTGSAESTAGEKYDVTATVSGTQVKWEAQTSQADLEKKIREHMETELGSKVKSLSLTRQPGGGYTGTAEVTTGQKYDVTVKNVGGRFQLETRLKP
jgi:hypothetical protein